jgi:protein gp37
VSATTIEWTDETWNPTTGCDRVSPGCDNCYALTMAKRLKGMGSAKYQTDGDPRTSGPGFGIAMHPDTLAAPFSWSTPRKVFVNSMSDLFHAGVSNEFIARVFAVMAATPQHTYQVLTKRPARMRSLLNSEPFQSFMAVHLMLGSDIPLKERPEFTWPLPNVWLGTSVEDQERANLRIPALLDTPAAVRFLSCEPLLGPVDLNAVYERPSHKRLFIADSTRETKPIDWVIVGGESGHGARPMHPDWARRLRDQCATAGIAFHFKQWGEWAPESHLATERGAANALYIEHDGSTRPAARGARGDAVTVQRNGKKHTGRELDGRTHDEFPECVA